MKNTLPKNINTFQNVIVTELELKDGTTTQMITIFNNSQVGFEEVNIGVKTALERSHNVKTMQSTFSSIKEGKLNPVGFFKKSDIKEYRPEHDY